MTVGQLSAKAGSHNKKLQSCKVPSRVGKGKNYHIEIKNRFHRKCKQPKRRGLRNISNCATTNTGSLQKKTNASLKKISNIETNSSENNPRKISRGSNTFKKGFHSRSRMIIDENENLINKENELVEQWGTYFEMLSNVSIKEPTFREVRDTLGKLKNNKALAEKYSLPTELLTYGGAMLITRFIDSCWLFEDKKIIQGAGGSPLSYQLSIKGIKRTLVSTGESRCYQHVTMSWLT